MIVSIITVNYNGKKLLDNFLKSVKKQNFSEGEIETIVVDNGSSDKSVAYIKKFYPWVKTIALPKNLGFGGGNNVGISKAKGDYLLLVNNDTVLDKNCVKNLVSCTKKNFNKKIGAIAAKILLYDKYLPFVIKNATFHEYEIENKVDGISIKPYVIKDFDQKIYEERVFVPIDHNVTSSLSIKLILKNFRTGNGSILLGNKVISKFNFGKKMGFKTIKLDISSELIKQKSVDLLQNTGNQIFRDGYGRDRGSMIVGGMQYYEIDKGQYDFQSKLDAFCGAGVFLNRNALNETGLFDENYFMYYEDDDLSFRLKENRWNIVFCHNAIIRHIHAASSHEWSPKFRYNVERGRLLFVSRHWPRLIVLIEVLKYIFYKIILVSVGHLLFGEVKMFFGTIKLRLRVLISLVVPIIINILKRKRLSFKQIQNLN